MGSTSGAAIRFEHGRQMDISAVMHTTQAALEMGDSAHTTGTGAPAALPQPRPDVPSVSRKTTWSLPPVCRDASAYRPIGSPTYGPDREGLDGVGDGMEPERVEEVEVVLSAG
ncbi:hypothetical protein GCM10014715_06660 [Streptomyces spiralis]|uniref:Uncharacterized protein n=1 Tax=Streptomyces spiralis TaxID=66376 RepID=A0A918ZJK5_9ACTN|nr:hypothetical protein GCM10014715_06660 [Streptomyces spiralis]